MKNFVYEKLWTEPYYVAITRTDLKDEWWYKICGILYPGFICWGNSKYIPKSLKCVLQLIEEREQPYYL